jgi:alpha-glucosidase
MNKQITLKNARLSEASGNVLRWQSIEQGCEIEASNCFLKAEFYAPGMVRFQYVKSMDELDAHSYAVVGDKSQMVVITSELDDCIELKDELIRVRITKNPLRISIYAHDGTLLSADDEAFGCSWLGNEVTRYMQVQDGERFIGLGEKTGPLDRRGKAYVNWNTDNFAYGVDSDPLYASIPFYMGVLKNKVYGIFFDNSHKTTFNFGASNRRFVYFQAEDGPMNYYFIHAETPVGILEHYTHLTGRMELPPLWSLGFQQCRYSYYPASEVLSVAQNFRNRGIPADVLYLDIHYMQDYKVFTWNNTRFENPAAFCKALSDMGFKVVVILDPGVKTEEGYTVYDDGSMEDVFVKFPDGSVYEGQVWPGWSAFPDFTHPKARAWWGKWMHTITDAGVEGFWNDMNEPASWGQHTPDLIEFNYEGEGGTHKKSRNVYGMQMARATKEGASRLQTDKRHFVLTRAGYAGIQRYAAVWTGDNVSSDEHMLAGVRLVNSMGLSGIPFAGYDVGGFAGEPSPELYARWIALGAFSPFFRAHSMINTRDAEPWCFGEEVEDIARNYINLRYRLMPYVYSAFYEAAQNGMPVNRSLALMHPHELNVYQEPYQNQYMFGPAILVIPVRSDQTCHKMWLPSGGWYNLYDDERFTGNQNLILEYGKEKIPVFVKAGSVLCMQQKRNNLSEQFENETLELHVYPGAHGNFEFYEDDGVTHAHQSGNFNRRQINLDALSCTIQAAEGSYASRFSRWKIYLHGNRQISTLSINADTHQVQRETYRFIEPISDFDPFVAIDKVYRDEISDLPFVIIDTPLNTIHITWK